MEDNLSAHSYFVRAASSIVQCYLDISANPELGKPEVSEEAKAKKEAEESAKKGGAKSKPPVDNGDSLLALGLDEANKFTKKLVQFSPSRISSHLLAFQVSFRRKKFLMSLQALNRALTIDPKNASVRDFAHQIFETVNPLKHTLDESVQKVFAIEVPKILDIVGPKVNEEK